MKGGRLLTAVFLGVLVLAWLTVFLPSTLRARKASPLSSAELFRERIGLLAPADRPAGRRDSGPHRESREQFARAQRRRRRLLAFLLVSVVVSAAAALAFGGPMWELQLVFDASLGVYLVLLVEAKKRRAERRAVVRPIRTRRTSPPEQGGALALEEHG